MTTTLVDTSQIQIWCGVDVGKEEHHACALDATGAKLFDKSLPQDEARLREVFGKLLDHGRVLVAESSRSNGSRCLATVPGWH